MDQIEKPKARYSSVTTSLTEPGLEIIYKSAFLLEIRKMSGLRILEVNIKYVLVVPFRFRRGRLTWKVRTNLQS